MKPLRYFTLLVSILLIQKTVHAQFQYFGVDGQLYLSGGGTSTFTTSLNYLKQVSSHHGFGIELGIPVSLADPARKLPVDTLGYDAGIIWKRPYLPYLGFRYRLFASNSFFIGLLANVGLMREHFFADRHFQYALTPYHETIPPVYFDYVVRSPFFRVTFESGFVWNMGQRWYGTAHARLGFQYTKAPFPEFGAFQVAYEMPTVSFAPYQGLGITGGFNFGIGVKI